MQKKRQKKSFHFALLFFIMIGVACIGLFSQAQAQNPGKMQAPEKEIPLEEKEFEDLSPAKKLNILNRQLRTIAAELLADLGPNELEVIYGIRANHGVIQSVKSVENDLALGVKTCLENNPEMTSLKRAFENWQQDVLPQVRQARGQLDKKVESQKIVKPAELKEYLRVIDLIATIQQNRIDKTYVSDKKQCRKLEGKLTETKTELRKLLEQALKPL